MDSVDDGNYSIEDEIVSTNQRKRKENNCFEYKLKQINEQQK